MNTTEKKISNTVGSVGIRNIKYWCNIRRLRLSLKYRPEILKVIIKMRQCIREKNMLLKKLNHELKFMEQQKHPQSSIVKNKSIENYSKDLNLNENVNQELDDSGKLSENQRDILTKADTLSVECNLIDNFTNKKVTLYNKSAFGECSVKDNLSQTKTDNDIYEGSHVEEISNSVLSDDKHNIVNDNVIVPGSSAKDTGEENPKEKPTADDELILSYKDLRKVDLSEAFTQTDLPIEDFNITDTTLKKSDEDKFNQKDSFTQTENVVNCVEDSVLKSKLDKPAEDKALDWTSVNNGDKEKSIAEQVTEVAQNAMQQSGMVYVESAGMYYDYKTGYYYNSELGLYYHTDTGCYYYYSDEQKTFVFHSYPERSTEAQNRQAKLLRKSKIHKKDEDNAEASKPKRRKLTNHKKKRNEDNKSDIIIKDTDNKDENVSVDEQNDIKKSELKLENKDDKTQDEELEDGECSDSPDEISNSASDESDASTATASDDESVAKHHPPCMRVIVRETSLPKLKVGNLFLVTKDGGTVGREGDHHAILLKDCNVSRNHLDIKFDADKRIYTAVDLGSKNGTILNGVRMSESQEVSDPMEVLHGSTLQLGDTKLLCHIHAGNDTCGHCEPGLIMEAEEKEKKIAYTRTCSVQMQHQLELARLKNKYAPQPLAILDTEYNDRAQARREKVGSSHHAEKTQSSDLNTAIAADNKGFKLLEKLGWSKGEGLGKDSQGDTEPIPLVSNEGKSGLGANVAPTAAPVITNKLGPATLRLAARTKMLQPPAKAFQQPLEEDSE